MFFEAKTENKARKRKEKESIGRHVFFAKTKFLTPLKTTVRIKCLQSCIILYSFWPFILAQELLKYLCVCVGVKERIFLASSCVSRKKKPILADGLFFYKKSKTKLPMVLMLSPDKVS